MQSVLGHFVLHSEKWFRLRNFLLSSVIAYFDEICNYVMLDKIQNKGGFFMTEYERERAEARADFERTKENIKKHNDLIRAHIMADSVWELRVFSAVSKRIHTTDKDFEPYKIPVEEIFPEYRRQGKMGGNIRKEIKSALKVMLNRPCVEIENKEIGYLLFHKLIEARLEKNKLHIQIHPYFKPYLLNLQEKFTTYSHEEFVRLGCFYTQRIFEILKSWNNREEGYVDISVKTLHEQLVTKEVYRRNFDYLSKIIERAKADIEKNTRLEFEFSPLKKAGSKKVVSVRFVLDAEKFELYKKTLTAKNTPNNQSNKPPTKLVDNPQRGLAGSPRSGFAEGSFDEVFEFETAV